jgi:hypothetical protein
MSALCCDDAMDANDSGGVDIADASYLGAFLFGGGPPVNPPWPTCGTDGVPDELLCEELRPPCP